MNNRQSNCMSQVLLIKEALHIRLRPTEEKINGLGCPRVLGAYHQDSAATATKLIGL